MRLSVDQIREAILHPEWEVRDMALGYFQECFSLDPAVMPRLIESVGKYGWTEGCSPYKLYRPLAQSEATIGWLIEQLRLPCPDEDRERLWKCWQRFLSWQLSGAGVELLVPHERAIDELKALDPECQESIEKRIAVAFMDPETGWRELESFCEQSAADYDPIDYADEDFRRFAEVILRDGGRFTDRILALLAEPEAENYDEEPRYWMHAAATLLAGHLRLSAAVPRLIERLESDVDNDGQWYCYVCANTLVRIGTDDVVLAAAERYPSASWDYRSVSSRIFEGVHSDVTVPRGLELLAAEEDDSLRAYLADSLLGQFDAAAVEPTRDMILRGKCDDEEEPLIRRLVAVATLMNVSVPELEPWRDRARASMVQHRQVLEDELTEDGRQPDAWDSDIDELMDEEGVVDMWGTWNDSLDDEFDEDDELEDADDWHGVVQPIVQGDPKVGRNDPCPCGSGKKFKKCCMNRQKNPPKIDW